ncbi:hypothetical protein AGR1B_Lc10112 [Agrobacterium fabacearum S56]|nr:hypothetical protein AGR1B_Lc10112 [Agrobacterium fabacearum S56]
MARVPRDQTPPATPIFGTGSRISAGAWAQPGTAIEAPLSWASAESSVELGVTSISKTGLRFEATERRVRLRLGTARSQLAIHIGRPCH